MAGTQLRKKNILVVDDEVVFLSVVKKLLPDVAFSVDTAETANEALELISAREFDIVITDITLSDRRSMEGLDILRFIREHNPDTKVIILTGCGTPGIREQVYSMGACLYLEKPLSATILRTIIKTNLGRK